MWLDQPEAGSARSYGEDSLPEEAVKVTRSIMIVKPPGYQGGSAPASPAGSTPPLSPFSPPLSPFSGEFFFNSLVGVGETVQSLNSLEGSFVNYLKGSSVISQCHLHSSCR